MPYPGIITVKGGRIMVIRYVHMAHPKQRHIEHYYDQGQHPLDAGIKAAAHSPTTTSQVRSNSSNTSAAAFHTREVQKRRKTQVETLETWAKSQKSPFCQREASKATKIDLSVITDRFQQLIKKGTIKETGKLIINPETGHKVKSYIPT